MSHEGIKPFEIVLESLNAEHKQYKICIAAREQEIENLRMNVRELESAIGLVREMMKMHMAKERSTE